MSLTAYFTCDVCGARADAEFGYDGAEPPSAWASAGADYHACGDHSLVVRVSEVVGCLTRAVCYLDAGDTRYWVLQLTSARFQLSRIATGPE